MKNILLLLLFFLAFAGCKDDDVLEPDAVAYEEWKQLPDSIIRYGYRDIVSTEYRKGKLHVQAKNSYYSLDSNLELSNSSSWKGVHTNSTSDQRYSPQYGKDYGIQINRYDGLSIFDLDQIGLDQISYDFSLDNLDDGLVYWAYSGIGDKKFSVVTACLLNDTAYYYLHNYQINHEPGNFVPINLVKEQRVLLRKHENKVSYPSSAIYVFRMGGKVLVHIDGMFYTYDNDILQVTSRNWVTRAFEADGSLYAASMSVIYFDDQHRTSDGLLISKDQGLTWQYYGYGDTYRVSNFKVLNGLKFMYKSWFIALLDEETNDVKEMNLDGLDAAIQSIEKVGDKVVVGTDAGVYYKSWESFLNK